MNNLMPKQELTIDSREVAKMLDIKHWEILRKLEGSKDRKGYVEILNDNQMVVDKYFVKSDYLDEKGEKRPSYLFTKMGCEFIANKFTGEKGILFTAKYVAKFNDMEQTLKEPKKQITSDGDKQKLIEARLRNAKARQANILLKMANSPIINDRYKQILYSQASAIIANKPLIPLPVSEEQTYSAGEIGEMLGISGNRVGRLTNEHNLKTEKYGKLFHDKSKYSNKEVETFRYYESIVPELRNILQN